MALAFCLPSSGSLLPCSCLSLLPRAPAASPFGLSLSYSPLDRPRAPFLSVRASAEGNSQAAGPSAASATTLQDAIEGEILSGEWPENFSILNFEDLCKHYEPVLFKEEAQPHSFLADVMSKVIYTATPEQRLEEIDHFFLSISGIPVVNKDLKCIGVLSKKDRAKASKGLQSTVGEVMSSPPISLSADKTVNDAAILMLKNKIHRIPIVNEANQVVGIVTRTDIFKALEEESP